MDFLTDRTMNLTELAMDGLMARQKVIAANIANAETPGYQRKDVIFEDQLVKIMQQENLKENIKKANSSGMPLQVQHTFIPGGNLDVNTKTVQAILAKNSYEDFKPMAVDDLNEPITGDGNNVNIEQEMAELSKNASKFMVLSELESRAFTKLSDVIKGAQ